MINITSTHIHAVTWPHRTATEAGKCHIDVCPKEETGLVNSMTVSVTNKAFHEIHSILKLHLYGRFLKSRSRNCVIARTYTKSLCFNHA